MIAEGIAKENSAKMSEGILGEICERIPEGFSVCLQKYLKNPGDISGVIPRRCF